MGNQIYREYDIEQTPNATGMTTPSNTHMLGGNLNVFKIYPAVHKTTKQRVSIFMANIKDLETTFGKKISSEIIQSIKREATILSKLRHPNILRILQPLIESGKDIAIVTEPVVGSLWNFLQPDKQYELHPLEIKYGLSQITEALAFCHHDASIAHLNLCHQSIYITSKGDWKLAGFFFTKDKNSFTQYPKLVLKDSWLPYMDYSAPEYVLHNKPEYKSDVFSIACLYHELLTGKPLLSCKNNMETYRQSVKFLQNQSLDDFKQQVQEALRQCLAIETVYRFDAQRCLESHLFSDIEIRTLRYLSTIELKEPVKKAQFMKNLTPTLKQFPERLLYKKILPPLNREMQDLKMVLFALPNILYIGSTMSAKNFAKKILPNLAGVLFYEQPSGIPLYILKYFHVLLEKTTPAEHKNFFVPFLVRCLEGQNAEVQTEALKKIEHCVTENKINYIEFKTTLLPKIEQLCKRTGSSTIRLSGVTCLGKVCSILDRDVLETKVIPVLEHCLKVDINPNLVMSVVGVYWKISKQFNGSFITNKILPTLIPLASLRTLDYDKFTKFMRAVQHMLSVVEKERMDEFEEEAKLKNEAETETRTDISDILNEDLQQSKREKQLSPKSRQKPNVNQSESIKSEDDEYDDYFKDMKPTIKNDIKIDNLLHKFMKEEDKKKPIEEKPIVEEKPIIEEKPMIEEKPVEKKPPKIDTSLDDLISKMAKNISPIENKPKTSLFQDTSKTTQFHDEPKQVPKTELNSHQSQTIQPSFQPLYNFDQPIMQPMQPMQPTQPMQPMQPMQPQQQSMQTTIQPFTLPTKPTIPLQSDYKESPTIQQNVERPIENLKPAESVSLDDFMFMNNPSLLDDEDFPEPRPSITKEEPNLDSLLSHHGIDHWDDVQEKQPQKKTFDIPDDFESLMSKQMSSKNPFDDPFDL